MLRVSRRIRSKHQKYDSYVLFVTVITDYDFLFF